MKKRVVITGMGIVSPVGNNVVSAWQNIKNGVSGIGNITKFDVSEYSTRFAGEIKNFSTVGYIEANQARKMDYFIRYGIVAGMDAVVDAQLEQYTELDLTRVGIIVGSGIGGLTLIEEMKSILEHKGPRRVSPFFITGCISNMVAGHLSMIYGYTGVNYAVVSACATANHSIGNAMRYIEYGDCDVMIAGGAESAISPLGLGGFNAMRALSTRNDDPLTASRPWDQERDGFVMGEGAGILILEEYQHALKRKAKIYAELIAYGASADAYHVTAPTIAGPANCMRLALKNAQLNSSQIDYINAHGTSTMVGDLNETNAVKATFGDHAYKLSLSSTKSMTGHLLGATAAVEAIFTIMALRENLAPPTINLFNPSVDCDLNYNPHYAREQTINYALNNSFGFGGTNSSLIFKKFSEE